MQYKRIAHYIGVTIIVWFLGYILEFVVVPESLAQSSSIRFAVIGDYGDYTSPATGRVADMVKSLNPDFIVTVGDNNYGDGVYLDGSAELIDQNIGQYYHEYIYNYVGSYGSGASEMRFFPSMGNHEWDTPGAIPHLDYFTLPGNERYYDFIRGDVHFFIIDTDSREPDGHESDSVQAMWLQQQLAASTSVWNVVIGHHPPYSSGKWGSDISSQWPFAEWGADLVFSGHDHDYESLIVGELPYFVVGTGGKSIREFLSPIAGSQIRYNASYGAALVTANESNFTIQYYSISGYPLDWVTEYNVGDWVEFDVTSASQVNGNYNFGIDSTTSSSILFYSKEAASNIPELVIQTDISSYVLNPAHDTYVKNDYPNSNYGTQTYLRFRETSDTDYNAYLRFDVSGVVGNIQQATLRMFLYSGSIQGGIAAYNVSETFGNSSEVWTEKTLRYTNAPVIQVPHVPIHTFTMSNDGVVTATPTETAIETATSTATPTLTSTATATPTETATETATSTATPTLTSTATATPTETATETATSTATPTLTSTATATPTETATETVTPTATSTATPTFTGTPTLTATNTATPTATNTSVPTNTPVPAIYVDSLTSLTESQGPDWWMTVTVLITDTSNNPVQGVNVTATFSPINLTQTCTTDGAGACSFHSGTVTNSGRNGIKEMTLTINNLSGNRSEQYDPSRNVQSSITDSKRG